MYNQSFTDVLLKKKDDVATLLINREPKFNALNSNVLEHLGCYLTELEKDPSVRVVVLTGIGDKAFAAGADLVEFSEKNEITELRDYYAKFYVIYEKLASIPQPVIARVNGYAFGGGCLLALSCDMVVATSKSTFSVPEVNFGFTGGASLLPRLVGRHIASEITLLGQPFSAEDAYRWNLVNKITEEDELDQEIEKLCSALIKKNPLTLSMIKRCIKNSYDAGLTAGNEFEIALSTICLETQDAKKRITKFINKTKK